jgi:hypothetical protein
VTLADAHATRIAPLIVGAPIPDELPAFSGDVVVSSAGLAELIC